MHIERQFDVDRDRARAVAATARDETLLALLPESEIVASRGERRTLCSHYTTLGREGTATFHFEYRPEGGVYFEKICDGRVWRELTGRVSFEACGPGTRVHIAMTGKTKPFVPEFTIRGALEEQLDKMAAALRERIEEA